MYSDFSFPSRNIHLIFLFFGAIIAGRATANDQINELQSKKKIPYDPEIEAAVMNMVKNAGYVLEKHIVETDDGYLLTVHRLPNASGSPIFLQHGLLSSSADWLSLGKEKAFPYLLSNLGYDVWLGNFRGNALSKAHVNLSTDESEYWNFSWHEMGIYDLPAMIDYVVSNTNKKAIYIGHSMGTTGSYVMAAERPDMQDKLKLIISFAPVVYLAHIKSPLRLLAPVSDELEIISKTFGYNELFAADDVAGVLLRHSCSSNIVNGDLCANILFAIVGFDPAQIDWEQLTTIAGLTPAGSSTKCFIHYLQEVEPNQFRQYDYGAFDNLKKYGTLTPPKYDISKIKVPIACFYGDNDWLADVGDVKRFYAKLPNGISIQRVNLTSFNHIDFLWAKDAPGLLYDPTIDIIKSFD
ncbi:lipase 3 [Diachasma alloeum]|uniref:lipase 3 n=1 Tax=Diachasma alloeum TaxID=454923 RepID=UPI0007384C10|nr:lipase 3 [Diachasma alloeum]